LIALAALSRSTKDQRLRKEHNGAAGFCVHFLTAATGTLFCADREMVSV
jgi:hypothetical protein